MSGISGAGGFTFAQQNTELCKAANSAGICSSTSSGNEYNSFASFLLGVAQTAGAIYQQTPNYFTDTKLYSFYGRDQWQVSSRFTVNLGLRYDFVPIPLRNGTGPEYYNISTNNMQICGLGSVPDSCGIFNQHQNHLAPRIGAAYRIGEKMVVRAGYGISTDPTNLFALSERRMNFPFMENYILQPPQTNAYITTLAQGITPPPDPYPLPSSGAVQVPGTSPLFTNDAANFTRGYVETWNATVEERIRPGWTASVGYAGSRVIDPLLYIDAKLVSDRHWYCRTGIEYSGTERRTVHRRFARQRQLRRRYRWTDYLYRSTSHPGEHQLQLLAGAYQRQGS